MIASHFGKYSYFPGWGSAVTTKLDNLYSERYFEAYTESFMPSVSSTKNRYSKEQKQQRSKVLIAQRARTTILSITMRTTTKHSRSPQDLETRLHARRSCASTSWIGLRVCVPVDCAGLDIRFLLRRGFPALPSPASFHLRKWSASS